MCTTEAALGESDVVGGSKQRCFTVNRSDWSDRSVNNDDRHDNDDDGGGSSRIDDTYNRSDILYTLIVIVYQFMVPVPGFLCLFGLFHLVDKCWDKQVW